MNITEALKKASAGETIDLERALKIAAEFDREREDTMTLLKKCEKNVGMILGEDINQHLATMCGRKFNAIDYHYEKPVGDQ